MSTFVANIVVFFGALSGLIFPVQQPAEPVFGGGNSTLTNLDLFKVVGSYIQPKDTTKSFGTSTLKGLFGSVTSTNFFATNITFGSATATNFSITGISSSSVLYAGANGLVTGSSTLLSFNGNQLVFINATGTSVTTTNLGINGLTKLGTITYAGAVNSYVNDVNVPLQVIGSAAQIGMSRTANTYGLLLGAYNASTYGIRSVQSADSLSFIVNSTNQALTITPTAGNVGIGEIAPLARLSIGAGSIADVNVPIQISTGAGGTQTNMGFNKNGAYGFLLGYLNNVTFGAYPSYSGGYMRMVAQDAFSIVMNSSVFTTMWNNSGDVGIGGNITSSSTMAGSVLNVKNSFLVGINTSTPTAQLSSQTLGTNFPLNIASSTGASMIFMGKTGNVAIGIPSGVASGAVKLTIRGDGTGDIFVGENSAGARMWTVSEIGTFTLAGTARFNNGNILNGSAGDGLLYTLNAGTSWIAMANVSTSVAFNITGPVSGNMNNNYLQISDNWSAPNLANIMVINKFRNFGFASSSPNARVAIKGFGTTSSSTLFITDSLNRGIFRIFDNGHQSSSSTPPAVSACGTSPTNSGTDLEGEITVGTIATACTLTWANAYTNAPTCTATSQAGLVLTYSMTNTALTLGATGLGGTKVNYRCGGE